MKRGQTVLEYALLIAIVSAALMTMSMYVRRAVQGSLYKIEGQITAKATVSPTPASPPCTGWPCP